MSPATLRRFRAERLLRAEFEALRERVLGAAAARLRGAGCELSRCDLEACYAMAWQGLYMMMLEGAEVASPAAWLTLVTYRRALDERRTRLRAGAEARRSAAIEAPGGSDLAVPERALAAARERDLAAELDDRRRLRHLFEGLRGRLDEREREAAVLCYLQGLTRAEAAVRMGVSEARMRKLMEGRGEGRPGVAGKVGALVASIREERWCEDQGSLMRALAYGVLDPRGERRRLALAHVLECPGCRAYVSSLRGLAVVLPPVLAPWSLAVAALAPSGAAVSSAGCALSGGAPAAAKAGGAAPLLGARIGGVPAPAVSSAAAGAGASSGAGAAAGGGWLLAGGPLGAKLALGCLLAVGVGSGCLLEAGVALRTQRAHRGTAPARSLAGSRASPATEQPAPAGRSGAARWPLAPAAAGGALGSGRPLTPQARASREFGVARAQGAAAPSLGDASSTSSEAVPRTLARAASSSWEARASGRSPAPGGASGAPLSAAPSGATAGVGAGSAAREFSPG